MGEVNEEDDRGWLGKAAKGEPCEGGMTDEGGGGRSGKPPMDCCVGCGCWTVEVSSERSKGI